MPPASLTWSRIRSPFGRTRPPHVGQGRVSKGLHDTPPSVERASWDPAAERTPAYTVRPSAVSTQPTEVAKSTVGDCQVAPWSRVTCTHLLEQLIQKLPSLAPTRRFLSLTVSGGDECRNVSRSPEPNVPNE